MTQALKALQSRPMAPQEEASKALFERVFQKKFEASLYEALGATVPISIQWTQISHPSMPHLLKNSLEEVYYRPLTLALEQLRSNELRRQKLIKAIKGIVFMNDSEASCYSPSYITLQAGNLVINTKPIANPGELEQRLKRTQAFLLKI